MFQNKCLINCGVRSRLKIDYWIWQHGGYQVLLRTIWVEVWRKKTTNQTNVGFREREKKKQSWWEHITPVKTFFQKKINSWEMCPITGQESRTKKGLFFKTWKIPECCILKKMLRREEILMIQEKENIILYEEWRNEDVEDDL